MWHGNAIEGMQPLGFIRILVPGVGNEFLHLLRILEIDLMHLGEVAVDNGTTGK